MDPFLKQAYDEGRRKAAVEFEQKLKEALRKREALVGWKEKSVAPAPLSNCVVHT